MNHIEHAKREFLKLGYKPIEQCENDPDKWIQENVLELLDIFSKQGHSGFSAQYAISYFEKLAKLEPIAPILCTDDEWNDYGYVWHTEEPGFQNNRCSAVFKKGINGKPYYLDAIIWRDESGNTFTGSVSNSKGEKITSYQNIKIPFTPKHFYINVYSHELEDDTIYFIKDDSQLKEVWEYYEHQETPSYVRYMKLKKIKELI